MFEPTIKDIAKICGVGVSTVSRAINNHPDINPETKEKIMMGKNIPILHTLSMVTPIKRRLILRLIMRNQMLIKLL